MGDARRRVPRIGLANVRPPAALSGGASSLITLALEAMQRGARSAPVLLPTLSRRLGGRIGSPRPPGPGRERRKQSATKSGEDDQRQHAEGRGRSRRSPRCRAAGDSAALANSCCSLKRLTPGAPRPECANPVVPANRVPTGTCPRRPHHPLCSSVDHQRAGFLLPAERSFTADDGGCGQGT